MIVTIAEPQYRPVTIVLETQDELDKMVAIVAAVAQNKINHTPVLIRAAADMIKDLIHATEVQP